MIGVGELGSTTDPLALVPGSVSALRADAEDLRTRATELTDEADGPVSAVVGSWVSDNATTSAQNRAVLAEGLSGVADVYRAVASVLDAHADILAWAQDQAAVAIELWAEGVNQGVASGAGIMTLRPRAYGPFGPQREVFPESDAGAPLRRLAETVLGEARAEVNYSQSAAARVLDEFCAGMPDGQFHFDEFLAGIGDWVAGIATLVWRFNAIRAMVDHEAVIDDAQEMGQGLWDIGAYLAANPTETVPVLLNTRLWHDRPGRWWGQMFPDLALTVGAAGTGLVTKGAGLALRAANALDELADTTRGSRLVDELPDPGRGGSLLDELADTTRGSRLVDELPDPGRGGNLLDDLPDTPGGQSRIPPEYEDLPLRDETSGQRGAWNRDLYTPEPSTVYRVDDRHIFATDDLGRTEHVTSTLEYRPYAEAEQFRNGYQQGLAGGADRLPGDEGGHAVAATLGGPGEPINLLPMDRALNQQGAGTFGALEEHWRTLLRSDPDTRIDVEIDVDYPPGSRRPSEITVNYSVDGVPQQSWRFYQ